MNGSATNSLATPSFWKRRSFQPSCILVFVAAFAVAACGDPGSLVDRRVGSDVGSAATLVERTGWTSYRALLEDALHGERQVLRVRTDKARGRLWVLGLDYVDVYDITRSQLIRRISLPGWYVADSICQPDLVVDPSGAAIISHNAEPKLWTVASDTLELKRHALHLVNREQLDIGFGALAFAQNGKLFGSAATGRIAVAHRHRPRTCAAG